jgi:hypothetical protein
MGKGGYEGEKHSGRRGLFKEHYFEIRRLYWTILRGYFL